MKKVTLGVIGVSLIIAGLLVGNIIQSITIQKLNQEKEVYGWRTFTAYSLLADAETRRILCTTYKKENLWQPTN